MRFFKSSCLVFSFVLVFVGTAMAADYVDIGLATSEAGHPMVSWGPIEPTASGGAYGGVTDCRTIWSSSDNSVDAFVDMTFAGGPELISFRHLDGPADDSFEVWMPGSGSPDFIFNDPFLPGENWYVSGFNWTAPGTGPFTIRFEAIGPAWPSWQTYGQVAIDWVWVGPGGPVAAEQNSWGEVKALFR